MSWILSGYTVVFAAFLNPAGRLGDRYGHRRIFLWGRAVFTLGSAACGLSGSLALLLAAVPASRRATAVQHLSAVGAMAAALGPPVGGLLVEFSWRWIFFVNVPLGLLALAVGPMVLVKTTTAGVGVPPMRSSYLALLVFSAAFAAMLLGSVMFLTTI